MSTYICSHQYFNDYREKVIATYVALHDYLAFLGTHVRTYICAYLASIMYGYVRLQCCY